MVTSDSAFEGKPWELVHRPLFLPNKRKSPLTGLAARPPAAFHYPPLGAHAGCCADQNPEYANSNATLWRKGYLS